MPQGFMESPYFSQTLKADPDNIKFPGDSTLIQYVEDLLLCSSSQASSQEDSIHLLKLQAKQNMKSLLKNYNLFKLNFDI